MAVIADHHELPRRPPAEVSAWREAGGQRYLPEAELNAAAEAANLALTPRLFAVDASELPTAIDKTRQFLADQLPETRCALDDGGTGGAEGIVLRTQGRTQIAEARFQDYDRTLRRRR